VLGARLAGARRIIAVDLVADKLALARELGATDAFDAGEPDCVQAVRDATSGGVDVALEMAGSVKAMALAWQITRRGGTTVTAGLPHPDHRFALPQVALVGEERTIKGQPYRQLRADPGRATPRRAVDHAPSVAAQRAGRPPDRHGASAQRPDVTRPGGACPRARS
jgi:alcohol dehydrogenase